LAKQIVDERCSSIVNKSRRAATQGFAIQKLLPVQGCQIYLEKYTKNGHKMYPKSLKYVHIPDVRKMYQMAIKYADIFIC
jgi:hypothetical protein